MVKRSGNFRSFYPNKRPRHVGPYRFGLRDFAPAAAGLAWQGAQALSNRFRGRSGKTRNMTRQADNADGAPNNSTGTNKQFAVSYRNRRLSRGKRRQFKQVKRWKYCWSKVQGLKSMTLKNRLAITTLDGLQNVQGIIALNGLNNDSGADYGFGDIPAIKAIILGSTDPGQKQRFMVNKIILDLWIRNISEDTAFVDLYEYVLQKDMESELGTNLNTVFQALYDQSVRVVGTQEFLTNLGWSPFEVAEICSRFKILKVHRLQIAAGDNMSFHRVYKQRYIPSVVDLNAGQGHINGRKYKFRGFFARIAGDQTSSSDAVPVTVSFLSRRTYFYSTLFDSYNDQGQATPLIP